MKDTDRNCKKVIFWLMLIEIFLVWGVFVPNVEHKVLKKKKI